MSKATSDKDAAPFIKPGTLGDAPRDDDAVAISEALEANDMQSVAEHALKGGRKFTYERELKKLGVERDDKKYLSAMEWAMIWLYEKRPFYAYCFEEVIRQMTFEVPTLAIGVRGGRIYLMANPDFLAIHVLRHNVGFLQHEIGHLVHGHVAEGAKRKELFRDPLVNIAMDLAVDSSIQSEGDQPDWVLLPSKLRIPEKGVPEDKWKNFPERATWEQYYDLLKQMQEKFPQSFKQQVKIKIVMRPSPDQGSGGEGDGEGDLENFDDHSQWGDSSKGDGPETTEHVIKLMVRQAYDKAQQQKGGRLAGYLPGNVIEKIEELLKAHAVPFDRLLRMFVGQQIKVGRKPTVIKLSRRRGVPPGRTFERKLTVLWLRDTSGSMPSQELALAYNELYSLAQDSNVTVLVQDFDHGLQGEMFEINSRCDVRAKAKEVRGRGGTDFMIPVKLAEKLKPDVALIFTDGYAPWPDKPPRGVPFGWIITHDGVDADSVPWGMVIKMPSKQEIEKGFKARVARWR